MNTSKRTEIAAPKWKIQTRKLLSSLAIATLVVLPALAASHQPALQSVGANHPYAKSHEAGDYKYCMKGTGLAAPGCVFESWEQCIASRIGIGGYCYVK
jgi:hypothetical protein